MKRCVKETYKVLSEGMRADCKEVMEKYLKACKCGLISDAEAIVHFGQIWNDSRMMDYLEEVEK